MRVSNSIHLIIRQIDVMYSLRTLDLRLFALFTRLWQLNVIFFEKIIPNKNNELGVKDWTVWFSCCKYVVNIESLSAAHYLLFSFRETAAVVMHGKNQCRRKTLTRVDDNEDQSFLLLRSCPIKETMSRFVDINNNISNNDDLIWTKATMYPPHEYTICWHKQHNIIFFIEK